MPAFQGSGGVGSTVESSEITDDTIVNADVNSAAAIVLTKLATSTSAQLATLINDETGSGALVFGTSPTLTTPALGTPASGVATNLTGTAASLTSGNVTTNANLTGDVTSVGNATTLGTVVETKGGTNQTTYTQGDVLYASASNTLSKLGAGTSGQFLKTQGAGANPIWSTVSAGGSLELLYSETLSVVGTSMTYTPSTPLSQNDYDYFLVQLDGKSGGVGDYQMRINTSDTQNYYYAGRRISDVPTETLIGGSAQAYQRIGYAGAWIGNDMCVTEIWFEDGNDMPIINSWSWNGQSQIEERIIGQNNHANSFDTLINLEVSHSATGKLRDGSIFRVWGVNKAT